MKDDLLKLDPGDFTDYAIEEPSAIAYHFRQLWCRRPHKMVVTCEPSGLTYTLGHLVGLTQDVLEVALENVSEEMLREISSVQCLRCTLIPFVGARTLFVSYPQGEYVPSEHESLPSVLNFSIPKKIFYVQRRELFRVGIASSMEKCFCSFDHVEHLWPVLDLSLGGMAIEMSLDCGTRYHPGQIVTGNELVCGNGIRLVGLVMKISNIGQPYEGSEADGEPRVRMGLRFIEMDQRQVALLQRYIAHLERRQHLFRDTLFL